MMHSSHVIDTPEPNFVAATGRPHAMPADPVQRILFRGADIACSLAAFLLAYSILPWTKRLAADTVLHSPILAAVLSPASHGPGLPSLGELSWVFVVVSLAMTLTLEYAGDDRPLFGRPIWSITRSLSLAMLTALSAVATVFLALRVPPYSRIFLLSYVLILFALAVGYRLAVRSAQIKQRGGAGAPRVLVAGSFDNIDRFLAMLPSSPHSAINIVGCLMTRSESSEETLPVDVLGYIGDLGDLLIHDPIDEVIVILPDGKADWLPAVIEHCDYFRVSVALIHECFLDTELRDLRHLNPRCPLPSIRLIPEEELTTSMLVWKRALDVLLSLFALIVLSPVMAAIAIAIKITTPHLPVFYRWNVVGYRGRRFTGYKFTTMVADADDRKADLAARNEMSGPVFKIRDDPRVTRLGKFLRKYSLNELPQFWSVLVGDMSLVGPRPAGPHELVRYEMWHKRKLSVQPGITCFWQVRGRNGIVNFDDWVRMDLEYIQKRGFWTDLRILLQTVSVVIRGTGC